MEKLVINSECYGYILTGDRVKCVVPGDVLTIDGSFKFIMSSEESMKQALQVLEENFGDLPF